MGIASFRDQVAVVTGGGSGIGLAVARALAAAGARLVLGDIEADALAVAVASIESTGAEVVGVQGDVSSYDDVERLATTAMDRYGALHLAVNNAGVASGGPMWELDAATWDWVLGVDLMGVVHGIRAFVPRIIASGGGHVVNTASMAGLLSMPFAGPYNVAKHGVVTLSETLHQELALLHPEVGVSVLCPGWVRTNIATSERNRPDEPIELDQAVVAGGTVRESMAGVVGGLVADGIDPDDVARMVLDAVREDRFYILTHPEWMGAVKARLDGIMENRPPAMMIPGLME